MSNMATVRTGEELSFTYPSATTTRTCLTGISRINERKCQTVSFGTILSRVRHLPEEPGIQLPARALTYIVLFFGLRLDAQVLEHKHSIIRSPVAELCCCFSTERSVSVSCFPRQPFQRTTHAPCVFSLCLPLGEFRLKSSTSFARLSLTHGIGMPADDKSVVFRRCDNRVLDPKINTYRSYAFRVRGLERKGKERFVPSNTKASHLLGVIEIVLKVFRNFPADFLPALQCGHGKTSVFSEGKVLTIEKERRRTSKDERSFGWFPVGFGGSIGRGRCPNGVAFHLGFERAVYMVVDLVVQINRTKRRTFIETDSANRPLIPVVFGDSIRYWRVVIEYHWDSACDFHT